jgi:hypothetical protein
MGGISTVAHPSMVISGRKPMSTRMKSLVSLIQIDAFHECVKTWLGPATHGNATGLSSAHLSQTNPNPTQHQGALKAIVTRPEADDVSAFRD